MSRRAIGAPIAPTPTTAADAAIFKPSVSVDRYAAVDRPHLAGDDSRLVRSEVDGEMGDVDGFHQPEQVPRRERFHRLAGVDHRPYSRRQRDARGDRVDPDRVARVPSGHRTREGGDAP